MFKRFFLNVNVWISLEISLKFVPNGPINNIPASVQIMTWRHSGDKPFSEPMMVRLLTHISVTRPQWVNDIFPFNRDLGPYLHHHVLPSHWTYNAVIWCCLCCSCDVTVILHIKKSGVGSQITGVSMVCSTVCSGADQRKYKSSASLAFVMGIHRWPVDCHHKGPVTNKIFPFDDAIMNALTFFVSVGDFDGHDDTWIRPTSSATISMINRITVGVCRKVLVWTRFYSMYLNNLFYLIWLWGYHLCKW